MNKNLSSNSYVRRINGYLDALSDIDGGQREFFAAYSIIQSNNTTIESDLELSTNFITKVKLLKTKTFYQNYRVTYFLENLLLTKPFNGLYKQSTKVNIPKDVIKTYRDYVIFHLSDYLNFSFDEEKGLGMCGEKPHIHFSVVQYTNTRNNEDTYAITLIIERGNIKQILKFYRKAYSKNDFFKLFNEIIKGKEDSIK